MGGAVALNNHPEFKIRNNDVVEIQRYRVTAYTVAFFLKNCFRIKIFSLQISGMCTS